MLRLQICDGSQHTLRLESLALHVIDDLEHLQTAAGRNEGVIGITARSRLSILLGRILDVRRTDGRQPLARLCVQQDHRVFTLRRSATKALGRRFLA